MTLKTATIVALAGVMLHSLIWLLTTFDFVNFSTTLGYKGYSLLSLLLGNGTLAFFLAVLLSKQKTPGQ
jgi:hypothetical protein